VRLYRRAQPSLCLVMFDALAAIKLRQPGAHLGTEGLVFLQRSAEQGGQYGLRLAVRLRRKCSNAAFEFGGKVQGHWLFPE
jgi:hypothetical protein